MLLIRSIIMALLLLAPSLAFTQARGEPSTLPAPAGSTSTPNGTPVDPTKNVLDLVTALKEMLKELRASDKELFDARLKSERDINELRAKGASEVLAAQTTRLSEQAALRAEFAERYAISEQKRVDAIRLVDKNAADVATAQALSTATGLAKAVQDTATTLNTAQARQAEDLRKIVETTALETNRAVAQRFADIQTQFTGFGTRLTTLEQNNSEAKGQQRIQDPALAATLAAIASQQARIDAQVNALATARATTTGASEGQAATIAAIIGAVFLVIAILGAFFGFMQMRSRQAQITPSKT